MFMSCHQMPSKFYAPNCLKEALLTQAGNIKNKHINHYKKTLFYFNLKSHKIIKSFFSPSDAINFSEYTSRVENVGPTYTSRWVARFFLAVVFLLGIYMTPAKISRNRLSPAHSRHSVLSMCFTITWHCFSTSVNIRQPSEWIAVGNSFVLCVSCIFGRTLYVVIVCRTAQTVMKLFCNTQQQFKILPVTVFFIWLTLSLPFPKRNIGLCFEDTFDECTVRLTLRFWDVLGQIELLGTLYCVFVSFPSLLQSILAKINFLSVLLNVRLITCLQNSMVPTKYVLVIRITRLI